MFTISYIYIYTYTHTLETGRTNYQQNVVLCYREQVKTLAPSPPSGAVPDPRPSSDTS